MRPAIIATIALLLPLLSCVANAQPKTDRVAFVPPRVLFGSDISYPINSGAAGLVKLLVNLDANGNIQNVETIHDVPSLTAPALLAVNRWTFSPAMVNGAGVPSTIPVDILFNPGNASFRSASGQAIASQSGENTEREYAPPEVVSAAYGVYPIKALVAGPVVLDVRVSKAGRVSSASAIFTTPSFLRPAIAAVRKWRFTPGRFEGTPIEAHVVVAFVFRSPTLTTPFSPPPAGF